jgi:cation:H+ antiporter
MRGESLLVWAQFFVCVALIGFAGFRLSRYGDVIAEKTGLGGSFVGLVLLATVTSLPEMVTGIGAVALAEAPDIAVGNIFGACVMNLVMIVVLDLMHRGESVYTRASHGHILAASFGVILIGFVALNVILGARDITLQIGHVGVYTPLILLIYLGSVNIVFRYERRQRAEYVEEAAERHPRVTLRSAVIGYAVAAAVVVSAALWLPFIAEQLARTMGWNETFVGTLFVSIATTLPELAVTVSALRLGALDLAIGNLLGSNLFNLMLVAIDDLFFLPGPLLSFVSPWHTVSALSALMMTGLAIAGLLYRPADRVFGMVGWVSVLLLGVFITNALLLFHYGG